MGTKKSRWYCCQVKVHLFRCQDKKIFNNAAQHWNHTFYWNCITPNKNEPDGKLKELIVSKWGSVDEFLKEFSAQAVANFGSGWTWLAKNKDDIAIINTSNAGNPLTSNYQPLLTVDVWEHAYYIDYRNARASYLNNFTGLIDWKFVSKNLESDKVDLKFWWCLYPQLCLTLTIIHNRIKHLSDHKYFDVTAFMNCFKLATSSDSIQSCKSYKSFVFDHAKYWGKSASICSSDSNNLLTKNKIITLTKLSVNFRLNLLSDLAFDRLLRPISNI